MHSSEPGSKRQSRSSELIYCSEYIQIDSFCWTIEMNDLFKLTNSNSQIYSS